VSSHKCYLDPLNGLSGSLPRKSQNIGARWSSHQHLSLEESSRMEQVIADFTENAEGDLQMAVEKMEELRSETGLKISLPTFKTHKSYNGDPRGPTEEFRERNIRKSYLALCVEWLQNGSSEKFLDEFDTHLTQIRFNKSYLNSKATKRLIDKNWAKMLEYLQENPRGPPEMDLEWLNEALESEADEIECGEDEEEEEDE
jgi:hypothetical protein